MKMFKEKSFFKILIVIIVAMIFAMSLAPNVFADSIVQHGSISWNGHKVGDFTLGGRQAFCMVHKKAQPPSGTWYNDNPYYDVNIRKTLYYGWAGEEQWSGFNGNRAKGVVSTTMLINYYYTGGKLSSDFYDFKNFIESQPEPAWKTNFSRQDLDTHIDGNIQRTDTISVDGSNMPLRFWVDNDITLVNDNTGARYSNCDAELRGGDRVHFEAPLTLNKNYSRGDIECRWQYPAILSTTGNSSYQPIARLGAKEPTERTYINVHFKAATGNIKITKRDNETDKLLSGANFNIIKDNNSNGVYDGGDEVVRADLTTGSDGTVTATNLLFGKYIIDEVQAPSEYKITNKFTGNVTVNANQTTEVTVKDEHNKFNLNVTKVDKDNHNISLGAVEFKLYNKEMNNWLKWNPSRNYYDYVDENNADKFYTDSDGHLLVRNLRSGDYSLKETKTNDWYNPVKETTDFSSRVDNDTVKVTVENELKKAKITIKKTDAGDDFGVGKGTPLKDVKFEVWYDSNNDGKITDVDERKEIITTDNNGIATTKRYAIRDYNKFYIREVSNDANTNYISLNENSIQKQENVKVTKINNENYIEYQLCLLDKNNTPIKTFEQNTLNISNKPKQGRIKVVKLDEYDKKTRINGITFALFEDTNSNGKLDDGDKFLETMTTKDIDLNNDGKITDDEKGIALSGWHRIDKKYFVREVSTVQGYILSNEILEFKLDWNKTQEKFMENCPKTTQVKVYKTIEGTKVPLQNISFDIYKDINGNGKIDKEDYIIDTITTDKNGIAISKKYDKNLSVEEKAKVLRVDTKYILRENTKGITLENDKVYPLDFTKYIKEYQENIPIKNLDITNHIELKPVKKDIETRKKLANATYDIYQDTNNDGKLDKNDKKIETHTFTTDKNGDGHIAPLPFGNYLIVETQAPKGYNLNTVPTRLVINHEGVYNIDLFDTIISSNVDIFKTTKENSDALGIKKGDGVPDTYFSIYEADENGKIKLDKDGKPIFAKGYIKDKNGNTILGTLGEKKYLKFEDSSKDGYYYVFNTEENGHVAKIRLLYGNYIIREVKSNPHFLNDSNDILFKVSTPNDEQKKENKEVILAEFNNTPHKLKIHIQKEGLKQAQPNDVIRYDFPDISNLSNVKLYNFTWEDNLPYDYVKIQKLYTGVWNEDHTFKVYYKTNKKTDWTLFGKDYSNQEVNLIDFETLGLDNVNEYVTDFKIVFDGAVKEGYSATETPFIMTKVDSDVKATDVWTNKTKDYGWDWDGEYVEDNSSWDTTSYHQELKITKVLPRTGTEHNYILYVIAGNIIALSIIVIKKKINK